MFSKISKNSTLSLIKKFKIGNLKNLSQISKIQKVNFSNNKFTKISIKNFSNDEKVIDIENENLTYEETNKENMGFKAETKKLLDIVTHSLYTDKEIFLRELLSNSSDALEKQRFMETNGELEVTGEPLSITVTTNEKNRSITIFDTGVGMTRQEMIDNLGTIAKSGTQNFVKNIKEQKKEGYSNESLIGQFGVGFYSSFIVGDTVEVISRPQGAQKATQWTSDGNGEFAIADVENCDFARGTKVIIHLKLNAENSQDNKKSKKLLRKKAILFPIQKK